MGHLLIWAIVAVVVIAGAYLFLRWGTKPIYYRQQSFADFLRFTEGLFSQGGHGAVLFIDHEGSERFVQFAKYLTPQRMVRFGFPDAPWSREHYQAVQRALASVGFDGYEEPADKGEIVRFLHVDGIGSAEDAAKIAVTAFEAMGLDGRQTYTIHQKGPLSLREWKLNEETRESNA